MATRLQESHTSILRHESTSMNNSRNTSLFTLDSNVNSRLAHKLTQYTQARMINSHENEEIQLWVNIKARGQFETAIGTNLNWLKAKKCHSNCPSLDTPWTIIHGRYLLKGQTQTPFLFSYFEWATMTDWFIFCKGKLMLMAHK